MTDEIDDIIQIVNSRQRERPSAVYRTRKRNKLADYFFCVFMLQIPVAIVFILSCAGAVSRSDAGIAAEIIWIVSAAVGGYGYRDIKGGKRNG